jgi:integrase
MLSPKLLEVLRDWWRLRRPTTWLFPGDRLDSPIGRGAMEQACHRARRRAGLTKPLTPHVLRHYSAFRTIPSDWLTSHHSMGC